MNIIKLNANSFMSCIEHKMHVRQEYFKIGFS